MSVVADVRDGPAVDGKDYVVDTFIQQKIGRVGVVLCLTKRVG